MVQTLIRIFATVVSVLLFFVSGSQARQKPAIPFERAAVESTDGRNFAVTWNAPGVSRVRIFVSSSPKDFVTSGHPRLSGGGSGQASITLPASPRWYFKLVPGKGTPLIVADRSLHLSSVTNFRDVGGYRTNSGRWVRMGVAYRSNALHGMTAQDAAKARALGIRLICDLRMDSERAREPDPAVTGAREVSANVLADEQIKLALAAKATKRTRRITVAQEVARVENAYRDFVRLDSARRGYNSLFERLSDPSQLPTVFHCTAGKDRTGWAQAILLTILGVPKGTILKDYEMTDRYLAPDTASVAKRVAPGIGPDAARRMMRADPAYLEAAYREVSARYGSFDVYLHRGLKLDDRTLSAIRRNFLTD